MLPARIGSASAPRWRPPLPAAVYDRNSVLTATERQAIVAFKPGAREGHQALAQALERLLRPIEDALDITGSKPGDRRAATGILLRESVEMGGSFWGWSRDQWLTVLGCTSLQFRERNQARVCQSVRIELAALAYIHSCFRDVLALGPFRRASLARRVFGAAAITSAAEQLVAPLAQWGYAAGSSLLSCLCEALLRNQSPHLEHLSAETLDRFRLDSDYCKRSRYYQLGKALAAQGLLDAPLPVACPRSSVARVDGSAGVDPQWATWVERWRQTSTLVTRDHWRLHLYKAGRWLATHHPGIASPAQWTRQLAAEYVAAVSRMRVGDYVVREPTRGRRGQALSPRSKATELCALRMLFWDCQEWGWIPRRFDPSRSLALPRNIKALIGRKPRVITDDIWARLLWAGLNLEEADLRQVGQHGNHVYPVEYVRALALVWLFAGLRSDEISRLRVGCVRWQATGGDASVQPVCLLDVPTNKTGTCFTKPVDPQAGKALKAWEAVRPVQPRHTDRKTGEQVDLLFVYQARAMRKEIINESIIPMLCHKADVPTQDARGSITSHRARATIASQLFNSREPMSLFELQAWLGHGSPASTQHYVAITPTKLAKAYTDAGYFERNVRAIEVLIDQDAMRSATGEGEPWRYYDLGHGLCAYEFFDQCAHRMACPRCDFYRPRETTLAQLLGAKDNILRFLQEMPVSDDERSAIEGDLAAIERLTNRLANQPTPSGQTPTELQRGPRRAPCTPDSRR